MIGKNYFSTKELNSKKTKKFKGLLYKVISRYIK